MASALRVAVLVVAVMWDQDCRQLWGFFDGLALVRFERETMGCNFVVEEDEEKQCISGC